MNHLHPIESLTVAAEDRVRTLFATQELAARQNPCPAVAERVAALKALKRQVQRYQDVLAAAMRYFVHLPAFIAKLLFQHNV